ncbi:MAG: AbrB/MazE/SpoVT family DNA-binding domain-containing protein [Pseudomonadota bacterium]|nr:AbrB/MazE/SpoVT family DNA-binding domain-containing protein [Pseudomonadota bacterium]
MNTIVDTAKIFTTGRSQAVRLPKAYRFDTAEVFIERRGSMVMLRPKYDKDEWWSRMEKILDGFEGMPEEIERDRSVLSDPVSFD